MTIEDITALMRSGSLHMVIRFQEEDQQGITISGVPALFTPEFWEAFQQCQVKIFALLKLNDVRVCMDPDEHRASYRSQKTPIGKVFFMCPLCADLREEEKRNLSPVEDCTWVDISSPARTIV